MSGISLYNIRDDYMRAFKDLSDMGIEESEIKDSLSVLHGTLTEKCENVAMWRENQLVVARAKREAAKRMIEQAGAIERRAESMVEYLDMNMQLSGITEIECDMFKISYRKNPASVHITDQALIPAEFIKEKTTESVDKVALKKALQEGLECDGAEIVQDQKLVIK